MAHNGIDIDQFILLTIYPAAAFFAIGYVAKKTGRLQRAVTYAVQAVTCFAFAIAYFIAIPNGGAQGLAIVLALFGTILAFMAKKQKTQQQLPEEQSNNSATSS